MQIIQQIITKALQGIIFPSKNYFQSQQHRPIQKFHFDFLQQERRWIISFRVTYDLQSRARLLNGITLTFGPDNSLLRGALLCVSSIPTLYPLDASKTHPVVAAKNVSRHCQMCPGTKSPLVENLWSRGHSYCQGWQFFHEYSVFKLQVNKVSHCF